MYAYVIMYVRVCLGVCAWEWACTPDTRYKIPPNVRETYSYRSTAGNTHGRPG